MRAPSAILGRAMQDAVDFARLAADRTRLAVLGQLALGARTASQVAETTGLSERDVRRMLGRLCAGGLATHSAGRYSLDDAALRDLAARLTVTPPADPALLAGVDEADAAVAARYLRGSRLVEIPPSGARRSAVLRVLVDEFLPGLHGDRGARAAAPLPSRPRGASALPRGGGPPPPRGPHARLLARRRSASRGVFGAASRLSSLKGKALDTGVVDDHARRPAPVARADTRRFGGRQLGVVVDRAGHGRLEDTPSRRKHPRAVRQRGEQRAEGRPGAPTSAAARGR